MMQTDVHDTCTKVWYKYFNCCTSSFEFWQRVVRESLGRTVKEHTKRSLGLSQEDTESRKMEKESPRGHLLTQVCLQIILLKRCV